MSKDVISIAGLDIGSRTTKLVVRAGDELRLIIADSGPEPLSTAERLVSEYAPDVVWATGYGRHLAKESFAQGAVTEIRAAAVGARHLFPECRTVIDVGGQDCKVIMLDETGRALHFEMNDRCAAGTGKFLEVMAERLGFDLEAFGKAALDEPAAVPINSTCTVFAESEVVSLIARGEARERIAKGLHLAVAERVGAMVIKAGGARPEVVFCGGVAHNLGMRHLLEERLHSAILIPNEPQMVAALGALLVAERQLIRAAQRSLS